MKHLVEFFKEICSDIGHFLYKIRYALLIISVIISIMTLVAFTAVALDPDRSTTSTGRTISVIIIGIWGLVGMIYLMSELIKYLKTTWEITYDFQKTAGMAYWQMRREEMLEELKEDPPVLNALQSPAEVEQVPQIKSRYDLMKKES